MMMASDDQDVAYVGDMRLSRIDNTWYSNGFFTSAEDLASMRNCDVGEFDILLASFPKSGSAWLQRIVSLIQVDADLTKANSEQLDKLVLMLEMEKCDAVLAAAEPRIIKSHLRYKHTPHTFQEGKGKIIYLVRNPKDVAISSYYFYKSNPWYNYNESFEQYFDKFIEGKVSFGSWIDHLKSYLEHRYDTNILVVSYEDLQQNSKQIVAKIANHLEHPLTENQIDVIANESSFAKMKSNSSTDFAWLNTRESDTPYLRRGMVGDWKNHFTEEMSRRVDQKFNPDIASLGITFRYE